MKQEKEVMSDIMGLWVILSGNCPWTTLYNVHGICPLFHEENIQGTVHIVHGFRGHCPHIPWIPWTLSTHSMDSMDNVHGFRGKYPWIPWKMSRMSMESMDFLQTGSPPCPFQILAGALTQGSMGL